MKSSRHIYTVGYEGLSTETFVARLKDARIHTLVDIRELPLSRKAGFSKTALSALLAKHGIAYAHMPALGCPKSIRNRYKVDDDWKRYTADFTRYLSTQQASIAELAKIGQATAIALMCFEADFARCHRSFVAREAGTVAGLPVAHITARTVVPELVRRAAA